MRDQYQKKFNLSPNVTMNAMCKKYSSLISDSVDNHSIQEGLASMLTWFWIYYDVGNYIHDNQKKDNKVNKYQSWIDTYGNLDYGKKVDIYKNICDYYANLNPDKKEEMNNIYIKCAQYEYDFLMSLIH